MNAADNANLSLANPLDEWGPRVECVNGFKGTARAHTYRDTTIILSQPLLQFSDSLVTFNATNSKIWTNDGGKTWTIDTIRIDEAHCT